MTFVLALLVVVLVGYLISLRVHPYANCRLCNGGGRHRGAIYTYSLRPCRRCGGNGRVNRWGTMVKNGSFKL